MRVIGKNYKQFQELETNTGDILLVDKNFDKFNSYSISFWLYPYKKHNLETEINYAKKNKIKHGLKLIIIDYFDKNIQNNYFIVLENNKIISFQNKNNLINYLKNKE